MGLIRSKCQRKRDITRIGYTIGAVRQMNAKTAAVTVHPFTMIFETVSGEVRIGHISSAVDHSAERELILKTRAFLNAPNILSF